MEEESEEIQREFTEEEIEFYVNDAPDLCPICGSQNINAIPDSEDWCDNESWREVICQNPECMAQWTETFKLTEISNLTFNK